MKVEELIKFAGTELAARPEGGLAAEVLLAHVLGVNRARLFIEGKKEVAEDKAEKYRGLVARHGRGEPVAYLINNKQFYGLDFYVDENVLIPRPETEMLVDMVLDFNKKTPEEGRFFTILDVGTGCGNIAVSLAKNIADCHVTAVDVSGKAIEVAKRNAAVHGVINRVDFLVSDLLENVGGDYDVIVANLPYIGLEKFNFVSGDTLKYEPEVALFGGNDGLRLYEKLFDQILARKMEPRLVLGEFGFLQAEEMSYLLSMKFGEGAFKIYKDLALIERVFVIKSIR